MGPYQGQYQTHGIGILYFKDTHHIKLKANLDHGMYNYVELMAIRSLMKLAPDQGILQIHIYGKSQLVIKWLNN